MVVDVTVALPAGATYKRITGTQDPVVNNGATVGGSVLVSARDAVILGKVLP